MESFSVKLKRAQLSTEVGEDGPALETVLEGPLLSAKRKKSLKTCSWYVPTVTVPQFYSQGVRAVYMLCDLSGACSWSWAFLVAQLMKTQAHRLQLHLAIQCYGGIQPRADYVVTAQNGKCDVWLQNENQFISFPYYYGTIPASIFSSWFLTHTVPEC